MSRWSDGRASLHDTEELPAAVRGGLSEDGRCRGGRYRDGRRRGVPEAVRAKFREEERATAESDGGPRIGVKLAHISDGLRKP